MYVCVSYIIICYVIQARLAHAGLSQVNQAVTGKVVYTLLVPIHVLLVLRAMDNV